MLNMLTRAKITIFLLPTPNLQLQIPPRASTFGLWVLLLGDEQPMVSCRTPGPSSCWVCHQAPARWNALQRCLLLQISGWAAARISKSFCFFLRALCKSGAMHRALFCSHSNSHTYIIYAYICDICNTFLARKYTF